MNVIKMKMDRPNNNKQTAPEKEGHALCHFPPISSPSLSPLCLCQSYLSLSRSSPPPPPATSSHSS